VVNRKIVKLEENPKKIWQKFASIILPVMFTILVGAGFVFHSRYLETQTPYVQNGVVDLSGWNKEKVFEVTGEWEFYWGDLLNGQEILKGDYYSMLVYAPNYWNEYKIGDTSLPGKGRATYHITVKGAEAGVQYGMRIQNMALVYRMYIDDLLIAQNGSFGDTEYASAFAYRPQLEAFVPNKDNFEVILQVENNAYAMGGMWESAVFGTYDNVSVFDKLISNAEAASATSLIVTCLFFLIFFLAHHGEKDMLILAGICILVLMRFITDGDVVLSTLFIQMPIVYIDLIQFLTLPWIQFMLLYFVYYAYGNLVSRWQVVILFLCSVLSSLFILLFPFDTVISSYMLINLIFLLVIVLITAKLFLAAWRGLEGASFLLFAVLLIMLFVFYEMFLIDRTITYSLLSRLHIEYMVFILAQVAVVALRYRRAQRLEIEHLKGQIRPHFIHNALTSIISITRTEPDRARELLVDFSSYLRGFYDYDRDELISFTQELELVNAYIALEQARFGNKLKVEYNIDVNDFLLPSLVVQPLVENAFVHGLREKDNGGTVMVYAIRMKNNKVRVGVRDDGVGFSEKAAPARRGVGIENINSRLSRLFRTSLVYLVPEDGGCEVYLEIPYKETAKYESMAD